MENKIYNQVSYIQITLENENQRIDNFLITYCKVPKSLVYRWLRKGEVRVNKKRVKQIYRLQNNDIIRIPPSIMNKTPEKNLKSYDFSYLEKSIIYEDKDFLIINKPNGLASHGGSGINSGLIERLRILRPLEKRLELVHRLDKETSGCILIAKKYSILSFFQENLKNHNFTKIYNAVVCGKWNKEILTIDKYLKKVKFINGNKIIKICNKDDDLAKESLTLVKSCKYYKNLNISFLELEPKTGRTHQLRVHTQFYNNPIIGDEKYGKDEINNKFKKLGFYRMFLHAKELQIIMPKSLEKKTFTAELDKNFNSLLFKN